VSEGRSDSADSLAEAAVPQDLQAELDADPAAAAAFAALPPSHRRDCVDRIVSAKRPATRTRRVRETVHRVGPPRD
jgi:uncharacterized protein YdeI (YjbR/CyaY-like superfamily)